MRLTLRTLLSYLDDMLEPSQARVIGQKAAESEAASELMARIEQVTRRRRLTTPPQAGSGAIDANTIAEYLDNVVTPEQAAEVEQICLASDVHLAEVAGCHQILTLVLGEPAMVPPSANQRMYGLVKGAESAHVRRPAGPASHAETEQPDHRDQDETLRLGMPPVGKSALSSGLILVGAGLVAACLLVFALVQVLNFAGKDEKGNHVAQIDGGKENKDANGDDKTQPPKDQIDQDKKESDKKDGAQKDGETKDKKTAGKEDLPPPPVIVDIPFGPPNARQAPIGQLVAWENKEPSILLQAGSDGKEWKRIQGKNTEVLSSRQLVALPGARSRIDTNRGVEVVLWGSAPELFLPVDPKQPQPIPPFLESVAELHAHDKLDLELTLHRGRIVLASTKEKPVLVRVRFENPSQPNLTEFFDLTLQTRESSILLERWSYYSPDAPFYADFKNPNRLGPTAIIGSVVLNGTVLFRTGDLTFTLDSPPGPAMIFWNSAQGPSPPRELSALPFGSQPNHMLRKGDHRNREEFLKARDFIAQSLTTKSVDVALEEALKTSNPYLRVLAIRCRAALDDIASLVDALDQKDAPDLRRQATTSLESWIAASRDNDHKLFTYLKTRFKAKEAEIIMEMLHPTSPKNLARPETYEQLIDCLVNSSLVIRELGYYNLIRYVPAGASIPYSAAAPESVRSAAFNAWHRLIPPGQLPPSMAPMKK